MSLERIAPALFVLLWSSGWIAPVYGSWHSTAELFLTVRFGLAALAFAALSIAMGAAWPKSPRAILHGLVSGALMHGCYLGGVWWAIFHGVPASVSGVIAALQPLMTAALAPWLVKERLSPIQLAGLVLGFAGILIALVPSFENVEPGMLAARAIPIAINVTAMLGVVFGTLYQKRFVTGGDMRTTAVWQYLGAVIDRRPPGAVWRGHAFRRQSRALAGDRLVGDRAVDGRRRPAALHDPPRSGVPRRLSDLSDAADGGDRELPLPGRAARSYMIVGTVVVVFGVWLAGRKPATV